MIGERIKSVKERLEKVKRQRGTQRKARERTRHLPRLAGRLHQRRQVDAVQRAGQGAGLCRRPAVRHARHHHARAVAGRGAGARCRCPTPWASSATCRTSWSRPSRPRCRKRPTPTCCCTSSTPPARMLAEQQAEVERVLEEIGAADVPQVLVFNKLDLLEASRQPREAARLHRSALRRARASASSSARAPAQGLPRCAQAIAEAVAGALECRRRSPHLTAPSASPRRRTTADRP